MGSSKQGVARHSGRYRRNTGSRVVAGSLSLIHQRNRTVQPECQGETGKKSLHGEVKTTTDVETIDWPELKQAR